MEKGDFFKILCKSTPEELNEFIASKGKRKMVNAITFIDPEENKKYEVQSNGQENGIIQCE